MLSAKNAPSMHRIFKVTTTGASCLVYPFRISESRFDNHELRRRGRLDLAYPFSNKEARPQSAFGRKLASVFSLLFRHPYLFRPPTGIFLSRKRISLGIAESRCWLSNPSLDPVPRAERRINNIDIAIGGEQSLPSHATETHSRIERSHAG